VPYANSQIAALPESIYLRIQVHASQFFSRFERGSRIEIVGGSDWR